MMPNSITVNELLKLSNINLIDIRNSQSYNNNHINGAINIPYEKLLINPNILDKNKKYYIYCQKGITSNKLCNYLNKIGYHTYSIVGGYEEWIMKK